MHFLEVVSSNLTPREPAQQGIHGTQIIQGAQGIHVTKEQDMKPEHLTAEAFNADFEAEVCRSFALEPGSEGFQSGVVFLLAELWKEAAAASPAPAEWFKSKRSALFEVLNTCHPPSKAPEDLAMALDTVELVTVSAFGRLMAERRNTVTSGK